MMNILSDLTIKLRKIVNFVSTAYINAKRKSKMLSKYYQIINSKDNFVWC